MNGTVVEVVDMKVEGEGVLEQDVDHVAQSIHDQSIQEHSIAKKTYTYNMDVLERQCVDEEMIEEVKKHPCIYNPGHMHARDPFLKETKWRQIAATLNVSTEYCKLRWKSIRDRYVKTQKEERRRIAAGSNKLVKPYRFAEQLAFLKDYTRERNNTAVTPIRDQQQQQQPSIHIQGVEDEELSNQSEVVRDDDDGGSVEAVDQGWATIDGYISSPSSYHTNSDNTPQHHLSKNIKHRSPKKRTRMQIPADEYVMNYLDMEAHNGPVVKRSAHDMSSTSDHPGAMNPVAATGEDVEQKYDEVLHFLVSLAPAMRRLPAQKQSLARIKIQTVLHELEFSGE